jgi:transglutaminase-like putative cysteine protease
VRSAVAALLPAVAVAWAWSGLEEPRQLGGIGAVLVLGLTPALVPRRLRVPTAVTAAFVGLSLAFELWPSSLLPRVGGSWLGGTWSGLQDGLRAFDAISPPFDPGERPPMHALVLVAVLAFTLAVAVAAAARRPLAAVAATVIGCGWALASVPGSDDLRSAALVLGAALWPLVVLHARSARDVVAAGLAGAAALALGVGAAGAGASPDRARLDWRNWTLLGPARERVSVRYVWNATYDGITFPADETTVLRIRAPRRASYWRATTLDLFVDDRWIENVYPVAVSRPTRRLPADSLLPAAAGDRKGWVKQVVEVAALDDDHLIGIGQPVAVEGPSLERVVYFSGGVMRSPNGFHKGERYTVWSYAPTPIPRQLLASRAAYPAEVRRYLTLDRPRMPAFGAAGRAGVIDALFRDDRYRPLWPYRPVWQQAERVTQGLRSPYEATLALERWLRSEGGFRYEEHPPPSTSHHPLVDFVVGHRSGYCQFYAGAMALMLRFIGVPARVAVGFTSGRWKAGEWTVTDHNAHAWVEAWFAGYGWLPFDPTPGRGRISAVYTLASDSADALRSLGRGELLDIGPLPPLDARGGTTAVVPTPADTGGGRSPWPILLPLLAALAAGLALVGTKALRRRLRYLTNDPRRLARAAALELTDVLLDQDVEISGGGVEGLRTAAERGLGVPARAFAEALTRARYGPPAEAAEAARQARTELRALLVLLRDRLPPRDRLRGALSLRSLRGA